MKKAVLHSFVYFLGIATWLALVISRYLFRKTADEILAEARKFGGFALRRKGRQESRLIGFYNPQLGYYLQQRTVLKGADDSVWLSLADPAKLDVIVEANEWLCSAGLFLSPELAKAGVDEFLRSGSRSSQITWITPEKVPSGGNW